MGTSDFKLKDSFKIRANADTHILIMQCLKVEMTHYGSDSNVYLHS